MVPLLAFSMGAVAKEPVNHSELNPNQSNYGAQLILDDEANFFFFYGRTVLQGIYNSIDSTDNLYYGVEQLYGEYVQLGKMSASIDSIAKSEGFKDGLNYEISTIRLLERTRQDLCDKIRADDNLTNKILTNRHFFKLNCEQNPVIRSHLKISNDYLEMSDSLKSISGDLFTEKFVVETVLDFYEKKGIKYPKKVVFPMIRGSIDEFIPVYVDPSKHKYEKSGN